MGYVGEKRLYFFANIIILYIWLNIRPAISTKVWSVKKSSIIIDRQKCANCQIVVFSKAGGGFLWGLCLDIFQIGYQYISSNMYSLLNMATINHDWRSLSVLKLEK